MLRFETDERVRSSTGASGRPQRCALPPPPTLRMKLLPLRGALAPLILPLGCAGASLTPTLPVQTGPAVEASTPPPPCAKAPPASTWPWPCLGRSDNVLVTSSTVHESCSPGKSLSACLLRGLAEGRRRNCRAAEQLRCDFSSLSDTGEARVPVSLLSGCRSCAHSNISCRVCSFDSTRRPPSRDRRGSFAGGESNRLDRSTLGTPP